MAAPIRKTDPQSRKFLLAELHTHRPAGTHAQRTNDCEFRPMREGTKSVQSRRRRVGPTQIQRTADPNAERLASLAAMTMTRQTPGLVLPFVNTVPTSFTYTKGEDKTLTLGPYTRRIGPWVPRTLEALQREYLPLRPGLDQRMAVRYWRR